MRSSHSLDALSAQFDDANLMANAGLVLPATLARHLGLEELYRSHVHLGDISTLRRYIVPGARGETT